MRPIAVLATLVCFGFICVLFRREFTRPDRQSISWAPFAWMFIAGSRFVSSWLSLRGPGGIEGYSEGSPLDRTVFLLLICWGAVVLARRDIAWGPLLTRNKWLIAYLLYCLSSVLWPDAPDVMMKRWIKDLGNPIMALVLLTEKKPYEALVTTLRRLGFLFVPLSILFIRYYPELGRAYSYGGYASFSGVSDQKNTLGLSCLIVGIGYLWSRLFLERRLDRVEIVLLVAWAYVMYMAESATAKVCLYVAFTLLLCARLPAIARRPTRILAVTSAAVCLYIAADSLFHVQDNVLAFLGRNETLTNRTTVWEVVRTLQTSAWFGSGFMTFWNGDRMLTIWQQLGPGINQAHSGYLEQYLNLGYIGVAFIIMIALSTLWTLRRQLKVDYASSILRLCFVLLAMLYNYTEASFYGINNMWVLFLLASINLPGTRAAEQLATAPTALATPAQRFRARAAAIRVPAAARSVRPAVASAAQVRATGQAQSERDRDRPYRWKRR